MELLDYIYLSAALVTLVGVLPSVWRYLCRRLYTPRLSPGWVPRPPREPKVSDFILTELYTEDGCGRLSPHNHLRRQPAFRRRR